MSASKETKLTPEVLSILDQVRRAVVENRLEDAAAHMIKVRTLIDAGKAKGGDGHVSLV